MAREIHNKNARRGVESGFESGVESADLRNLMRAASVAGSREKGAQTQIIQAKSEPDRTTGKEGLAASEPRVVGSSPTGRAAGFTSQTISSTPITQEGRHPTKVSGQKKMIAIAKPSKPTPDFPLFAHGNGHWAKKIKGKLCYFGKWDDPDAALAKYQELAKVTQAAKDAAKPSLKAKPKLCVFDAMNLYLNAKLAQVSAGLLEMRTFKEHQATCSRFANFVGHQSDVMSLKPSDFLGYKALREKTCNLVSVGNEIVRVKSAFNWLISSKHIKDEIDFGPMFRKPTRKAYRKHRREQGKRMFNADQIHLLLDEAGIHMRAMILLGINCGFGPADCAMLPIDAIDFKRSWIDFPRPKTETDRECHLWPETIDALKLSLSRRFDSDDKERVFIRPNGKPWSKDDSELSKYFTSVRQRVLPVGGMYWLRRTFETIAGGSKDQVAVDYVMGHVDDSMAAVYRQGIYEERLIDVANIVRKWMFPES